MRGTHAGTAGAMLLFSPATGLKVSALSFSSIVSSLALILRLVMMRSSLWWDCGREEVDARRLNIFNPLTSCSPRRDLQGVCVARRLGAVDDFLCCVNFWRQPPHHPLLVRSLA